MFSSYPGNFYKNHKKSYIFFHKNQKKYTKYLISNTSTIRKNSKHVTFFSFLPTTPKLPIVLYAPRAGRAAPRDFPRAKPAGNPEEQPCQPEESPSFLTLLLRFTFYFKFFTFQNSSKMQGRIYLLQCKLNPLLMQNRKFLNHFFSTICRFVEGPL